MEKLKYFTMSETSKFRFIPIMGYTVDIFYKHLGKGKEVKGVEVDPKEPNDRTKTRSGCHLFLPKLERMYDQKIGDKIIKSEITYLEALEKHKLIYTTTCGDSESDKPAPKACWLCKDFYDGVKTYRRQKSICGLVISDINNIEILSQNRGGLGESIMALKNKPSSHEYWIEFERVKEPTGFLVWKAKKSKKKIENLKELNDELIEKYGDLEQYTLQNDNFKFLTNYYNPGNKHDDEL